MANSLGNQYESGKMTSHTNGGDFCQTIRGPHWLYELIKIMRCEDIANQQLTEHVLVRMGSH